MAADVEYSSVISRLKEELQKNAWRSKVSKCQKINKALANVTYRLYDTYYPDDSYGLPWKELADEIEEVLERPLEYIIGPHPHEPWKHPYNLEHLCELVQELTQLMRKRSIELNINNKTMRALLADCKDFLAEFTQYLYRRCSKSERKSLSRGRYSSACYR